MATAFASLLISACGDGATTAGDPGARTYSLQPAPDAKPVHLRPGVVATVHGAEVTRDEFDRVYAERARRVAASGGSRSTRRLRHAALASSAMTQLIQAEAVAQRAKQEGISVSSAQLAAALDRQRKAFDSPAQWRQFLKRTHQTESAVRDRLRLQLLGRRVSARDSAAVADGARVGQERLRSATACRPGYVVALCSNAPSTPTEVTR